MATSTLDDPSTLPLSYATYCLYPDLLTRFSDPTSVLRSFDGRVGAILENDILVSSPNSNVLFYPSSSSRRVRLRRDLHFSHDDPLFYPQPFDELRPHLPLIRAPSPDPKHPFAVAWVVPSDEHFDVEAGDILYDAGILDTHLYLRLKSLAHTVLHSIPVNDRETDIFLSQGAVQVDRMLQLLQTAASRQDIYLRVALLQRNILELDARSRYCSQRWTAASPRNTQDPGLDVIGAFTDNFTTLDTLFHLGIPVWFVRPVKVTPDARIDRSAPLIAENSSRIITLPSGFQVDGIDAEPNHKVIWEGLTNKSERYTAMNAYLQSLLNPSAFFGASQPHTKAVSKRAPFYHITPPATSSGSSFSPHTLLSASRYTPYPQHKRKKPQTQKQAINTFLTTPSPAMPSPVSAWSQALALHSTFNQSLRRSEESGYYLPPPRLLDGPENTSTRAFYYRAWLKIRPVILKNLSQKPKCLSAKRWRCLLDVVGGHSSEQNSGKAKNDVYRVEMRSLLNTLVAQNSPDSFSLDDLEPRIEEFHGKCVDCRNEPPPREIASQIIWELTEVSFRQDLVVLDRRLDTSGLSLTQRNALLDACWSGLRFQVDATKVEEGIGVSDIHKRAPYIRALHQLMKSWRGNKPEELYREFPNNHEAHNYIDLVETVEKSLAIFYTTSFLTCFARAASIPYYITNT
ncbi:hypothetical protein F5878DRAFT_666822 [Lentinula raphanica]|uniref:Uncharacterized protein n=1 Tax=Lentinula raphanica TaxID=153919 RepID=A0AA38NWY3_9AGAR|nr:hypothetical protein F5878DRAFT_666822 [Lentinula raphanica]